MDAQKVRLFSSKIAVGETTILEKREERILEKIFLGISVFLECIILNWFRMEIRNLPKYQSRFFWNFLKLYVDQ